VTRLSAKKKQFIAKGVHEIKTLLLKCFDKSLCLLPYHCLILVYVARTDSNASVASKGIYLYNTYLNHLLKLWNEPFVIWRLLSFGFSAYNSNCDADRTYLRHDIPLIISEEVLKVIGVASSAANAPISEMNILFASLTAKYAQSPGDKSGGKLLSVFNNIYAQIIRNSYTGERKDIFDSILASLWIQLKTFTISSTQRVISSDDIGVVIRTSCYNVLDSMISLKFEKVVYSVELLLFLLNIAETDELSTATPLFKILNDLRELLNLSIESLDAKYEAELNSTLLRLGKSSKPSARLLYLQWIHRLFGWNRRTICSMAVSLGK
jgi:hypothetical protein